MSLVLLLHSGELARRAERENMYLILSLSAPTPRGQITPPEPCTKVIENTFCVLLMLLLRETRRGCTHTNPKSPGPLHDHQLSTHIPNGKNNNLISSPIYQLDEIKYLRINVISNGFYFMGASYKKRACINKQFYFYEIIE